MNKDFWFCRFNGLLYMGIAEPDEPVLRGPLPVGSVASGLASARKIGLVVTQIGICPPDMLGLADPELDVA